VVYEISTVVWMPLNMLAIALLVIKNAKHLLIITFFCSLLFCKKNEPIATTPQVSANARR
jgi:hypothetical protein